MARKPTPPAFQFYPNDWLGSSKVGRMSPAAEGAYIRLLCYAWGEDDCSVPADPAELAYLSRLGPDWDLHADVLSECFKECNGRWVNERLFSERQKQRKWRKKCSEGGKRSAKTRDKQRRAKALAEGKGSCDLVATPLQVNRNSSSSSSTSDKDPPTPRAKKGGFKTWDLAQFQQQCETASRDAGGLLTQGELWDFVEYWTEPSSSGRFKFALERTWDTRRRMQTARRLIYDKRPTPDEELEAGQLW